MKHFKISKMFETKNKTIFQFLVYNENILQSFNLIFTKQILFEKNQQIINYSNLNVSFTYFFV